ncbi:MAG TPA: tRNA dihydrouridine(20/20a) synthase DusA [Turneriella sp.]|nr:tRNA dihydrouridine(20/20a) synthase DusA [Turneriella sp.]
MTAAVVPWEKVSIAPMMEITDRRFRYFMRLINPKVRLYTEMIVAQAITRGNRDRLLRFDSTEHPVVLQLGGSDPQEMAAAAHIGEEFGYNGIDVNCGCPSDRVGSGNFGACLMRDDEKVADIVARIVASVRIPVSVKCRIGITGEESEEKLLRFAQKIFAARACRLTVHARTATLGGLSPKENRSIPPLRYDWVYRLKSHLPQHEIEINGGIRSREEILTHLASTDGVMLGRLAHEDPFFFYAGTRADSLGARLHILEMMADYAEQNEEPGLTAARFFNNMLNLFHGLPGSRRIRRFLSEQGRSLSPRQAYQQLVADSALPHD